MLFIRWPISLYRGAKPAVSKSTGILKWSPTNGHKIVPVLISLNRALRKNHPHQRDQKKFSKTSMQVLYAGMDSLSYPAPWKKAKPQRTDGVKMKGDPLDIYISMCFLAPPHSCSCPTLVEKFWEKLRNVGKFWKNFATIYALSCGEKLSQKVHLWRKNDKYQVCNLHRCTAIFR